jgi:hypothetical protein
VALTSDVMAAFRNGPPGFGEAYPLLFSLAEERPGELPGLAHQVLEELPAGSALIQSVLPWLDADDLVTLADQAVAALARPGRPRDAAAAVVNSLSLQLPSALTRHLPDLWQLDEGAYFYGPLGSEVWWSGANLAEIRRLADILAASSDDERFAAWECLLQTRTAEGWAAAWEHRDAAAGLSPAVREIFWQSVGVDASAGPQLRSLVTAPTYHLRFLPEALPPRPRPEYARWHPTWGQPGNRTLESGPVVTGGLSDAECSHQHGPLRRLLLLDPPPPGCAADGQPRLDLSYCFDCDDGWDPAFFSHDASGRPRRLGQDMSNRQWWPNSFDADDIRPAITVPVMHPLSRWQRQDWRLDNYRRENLNRIGGEPTWIQDPSYPACRSCRAAMPFLAQLDWSNLIDGEGITYMFWCRACAISAIVFQCT